MFQTLKFPASLATALASTALMAGEKITVEHAYAETSFDGRLPSQAVNGAGMTGATHDNTTSNMWMGKNSGNGDSRAYANWFAVKFETKQTLGQVKIWNYNQSGYVNRGFKAVDVYVATDKDAFKPNGNSGTFDLSKAEYWTKATAESVGINKADGSDSLAVSAVFDLQGVEALWVVLKATTLYSTDPDWSSSDKCGGYGGLSEVQFFTSDAVLSRATLGAATVSGTDLKVTGTLKLVGGVSTGELIVGYGATDGSVSGNTWDATTTVSCAAGNCEKTVSLAGLADGRYWVAVGVQNGASVTWSAAKRIQVGTISDIEWLGAGDGKSWNDAVNWTSGTVPTAEDTVVFGGDVTAELSVICGEGDAAVAKVVKFAAPHKVTVSSVTAQRVEVLSTAAPTNVITALNLTAPENEIAVWDVSAGHHLGINTVAGTVSLQKTGAGSSGIGAASSRTAGETEVLEGLLVFSNSQQLGTKLVVGGGENPAIARANNAWADDFNPFIDFKRTIEVKNKGWCDFASDGSIKRLFGNAGAGPVIVHNGGRFDLGHRTLAYQGVNDAIDISGEFGSSEGSSIVLDRGHFNVRAEAPKAVVVNANMSMQVQEGGICTYHIEDISSVPVDCTVNGRISYTWLPRDGFVKSGAGVLRLTGDNAYGGGTDSNSGLTDIQEGAVLIDNTVGSGSGASKVVVRPGTLLGGTGMIGGNPATIKHWNGNGNYGNYSDACIRAAGSTTAQAVVAPGTIDDATGTHVIGTLNVGSAELANPATLGNYTTLRIGVRPEGVDKLEVCGKVTIGETGTVLDFDVAGDTTKVCGRHVILSATEGIEGDFTAVTGAVKKYRPQFNADRTELSIDIPSSLVIIVR